jgi:hypothetical protein
VPPEDLVIDDEDGPSLDITDDSHRLHLLVVAEPAFFHDGQGHVQAVGHPAGALGASHVRRHDGEVRDAFLFEVVRQDRQSCQLVHRDIEEALDLPGVEVDGQEPVCARGLQEVGDKARRDGNSRLVLLITRE